MPGYGARMTYRDLSRFDEPVHQFSSIPDFLQSDVPAGILSIDYHGSPLDLLNLPRGRATTMFSFHAALSPRMNALPVFTGIGVAEEAAVNLVCLADPSLYLDDELRLAWFAGSARQPLQRDLPAVMAHIARSHGAESQIFFGASGGGFAALHYARHVPGSVAVPLNPMTHLDMQPNDALAPYLRACFGVTDDVQDRHGVLTREIVSDVALPYAPGLHQSVAYVQNVRDSVYYYRHLHPFLRKTPSTPAVRLLLGDWGRGHVPPDKAFIAHLLRALAAAPPRWDTALDEFGFLEAPTVESADMARAALVAGQEVPRPGQADLGLGIIGPAGSTAPRAMGGR